MEIDLIHRPIIGIWVLLWMNRTMIHTRSGELAGILSLKTMMSKLPTLSRRSYLMIIVNSSSSSSSNEEES